MPVRSLAHRLLLALSIALAGTLGSGCYSYSFQERAGGDLARVPIDRNFPQESVRWSLWWGLRQDTWAPTECTERDPEGQCRVQIAPCDYGAGQTTTRLVWYSAPTMILSLGIALPVKVVAYCATEPVQGDDPEGPPPSGP